jgi:hypothetical protein
MSETSFKEQIVKLVTSLPATIALGVAALIMWASVFRTTSDSMYSWSDLSAHVKKVIGTTTASMFILLIVSIIYFLQDQSSAKTAVFIIITIALGLSYSAIAAAATN